MTIKVKTEVEKDTTDGTSFADLAYYLGQEDERMAAALADKVMWNARARAPFRTGYLKSSISVHDEGHGRKSVKVGAHYGIYVEYGTRFMAAQPFFTPAVQEELVKFKINFRSVFSRYKSLGRNATGRG